MKRTLRAFTLIELLVVIAIIAILAAILFPVFAQAKLAAKKAADLSNIKQETLGLLMYSTDNDDYFPLVAFGQTSPIDGSWDNATYLSSYIWSSGECIGPYTKNVQILVSPDESYALGTFSGYPTTRPAPSRISYMPNIVNPTTASYYTEVGVTNPMGPIQSGPMGWGNFGSDANIPSLSQTQANHPSDVILLAEGRPDYEICMVDYNTWTNNEILWYPTWTMGGIGGWGWDIQYLTVLASPSFNPPFGQNCVHAWTKYAGGANFSFVDGHVKLQRPGDLMTGNLPNPHRWLMNDPN